MKAVLSPKAGPPEVLEVREIDKPTPKPNEILVRVRAATVTAGDVKLRRLSRLLLALIGPVFGFKAMKIPGVEYAGEVEELGSAVQGFSKGDAVVGTTTGLAFGANAEYVCVPEKGKMCVIVHKPESLGFREAASSVVGGMTALWLLTKAGVNSGDTVLVYGASGSVGTFALQLAKHFGAEVTGVASAQNAALLESLGADHTIDYRSQDFTTNGKRYDLIFDAAGKLNKSKCTKSLTEGGRWASVRAPTKEKAEELSQILQLVTGGAVHVVIDREFPLDEIVEAHRYVESNRKRGSVAITL